MFIIVLKILFLIILALQETKRLAGWPCCVITLTLKLGPIRGAGAFIQQALDVVVNEAIAAQDLVHVYVIPPATQLLSCALSRLQGWTFSNLRFSRWWKCRC
jgi:hypothetical protein